MGAINSNTVNQQAQNIPVSLPYVENIQKFHATCTTCDKKSETQFVQEAHHKYNTRAKHKIQNELIQLRALDLNSDQKEIVSQKMMDHKLDNQMLVAIMNLYAKDIFSFYVEDILAFGGGPFVNLYGRIEIIMQSFPRKKQAMVSLKQEVKLVESEFHKIANSIQNFQHYEKEGKVKHLHHANDWIEAMQVLETMLLNIKEKVIANTK